MIKGDAGLSDPVIACMETKTMENMNLRTSILSFLVGSFRNNFFRFLATENDLKIMFFDTVGDERMSK